MQPALWSKLAYEASFYSRCWWFTPYDAGWDHCAELREDVELRQIVEAEQRLAPLPGWVEPVILGPIRCVAPCGHYTFPDSFLQAVSAIGSGEPPRLVHTCFTVDGRRKRRMLDYMLCLDAWLAGAAPQAPVRELVARSSNDAVNWKNTCQGLWRVLGVRTEMKRLLVERLLHQWRWWAKSTVWDDDDGAGGVYGCDQYVGDRADDHALAPANGNPDFPAAGYDQSTSPRVRQLESKLAQICPDWNWFRTVIVECSWPCAPKAFRFLEKTLWCIGKERPVISLPSFPLANPEEVPSFLETRATAPNQDQAAIWWRAFLDALRNWWQAKPMQGALAEDIAQRLGEPTAIKRWLVRLLVHRLTLLAEHSSIKGLIEPPANAWRGGRPIV